MGKPVILFTNFWDANNLLKNKHFLININDSIYRVRLETDKYCVYSIALSHPPIEKLTEIKSQFNAIQRLDFFCPTYKLLMRYKNDQDWDSYTKDFNQLMKDRKIEVNDWLNSLPENRLYILCCWENTSRGANCHRKLIYDAMISSKTVRDKCFYVYRDGSDTVSTSISTNFNQQQFADIYEIVPF